MPRSIVVFHILNKNATGGAENLVHGLVSWSDEQKGPLTHRVIYIAKSRFATNLLSLKLIRIAPILLAYTKLLMTYLDFRHLGHEKVFIFHLAECHLLARIFSILTPWDNRKRVIVYLHQSRELFPTKLRPITESLIDEFHTICYSKCATDSWFLDRGNKGKNRSVLHNAASINKLPINRAGENRTHLNLLFVGRYVHWKRPDMALAVAQRLSNHIPVIMNFVGISESEFTVDYGKPVLDNPQLEVHFHGVVMDVVPFLQKADLLLNLAESSSSGESVGIAAMEALSSGVPVLVQDRFKTDFSNMPGIYDLRDIDDWMSVSDEHSQPLEYLRKCFQMNLNGVESWRAKVSIGRYNYELADVLEQFILSEGKKR